MVINIQEQGFGGWEIWVWGASDAVNLSSRTLNQPLVYPLFITCYDKSPVNPLCLRIMARYLGESRGIVGHDFSDWWRRAT